METKIGNPDNLWLMAMVFVTALLAMMVAWSRRSALKRLATENLLPQLIPNGNAAPWMSTALLSGGFMLLTLALLDVRWGKTEHEIPQKGIEVVFALDVSRSMLAEDAAPNRLQRAKEQIKDLMDEMAGDRVGLVAFAGEAKTLIPLTSHYEDFKSTLDGVGPHSIRVGGSRLGTALDVAARSFLSESNNHKAIVLLTDGEDQESSPVKVAERIFEQSGIRVFTIGLGDWQSGAKIPVEGNSRRFGERFLTYQGDTVLSRQDGETLKAMALAAEGAYIPAGTKFVDMSQVYAAYIAPIEKTEFETATVQSYEARFQWFALPAFLCFIGEVMWRTRRGNSDSRRRNHKGKPKSWLKGWYHRSSATSAAIVGALLAFANQHAWSQSVGQVELPAETAALINQANQQLRSGDVAAALQTYDSLENREDLESQGLERLLAYNRGLAFHAAGDLPSATSSFLSSAESRNKNLAAMSRYNLGNCLVESAASIADQNAAGPSASAPEEIGAAKELLRSAIQAYRDALRLDTSLDVARANIESAYRRLKDLEQQEKQQEQEDPSNQESDPNQSGNQQEQDQQSDQQDGSQQDGAENNQQQDDQQQEDKQGADQEKSGQQQNSQQPRDQQQSDQQQSDRSDSQNGQADDRSQSSDQSTEEDQADDNQADQSEDRSSDGQQESNQQQDGTSKENPQRGSGEGSEQQQTDDQSEDQRNSNSAANNPDRQDSMQSPTQGDSQSDSNKPNSRDPANQQQKGDAAESQSEVPERSSDTDGSQESNDQDSAADANDGAVTPADVNKDAGELSSANEDFAAGNSGSAEQQTGTMTLQEALKILQSIRDRDFHRRAELQRREQMRHVPVEKDW